MSLEAYIRDLIRQTGPISMEQFMRIAMAHPDYGYYKVNQPFGLAGDFTTSPEICQIFGELIGLWCAHTWQQMGAHTDIIIAEIGPGRGVLMADFLRGTSHIQGFHDSIEIAMVETSEFLTSLQEKRLFNLHPRIKWYKNITQLPAKPALIFSNELFDVLPVQQYIKQHGLWCEKMLGIDDAGQLAFVLKKLQNVEFGRLGRNLDYQIFLPRVGDAAVFEICPDAVILWEEICARVKLHGGASLVIDYGYVESEFIDTIVALRRHKQCDVLTNIGTADISAHVDFGLLINIAQKSDIAVSQVISQGKFLRDLGIEIRAQMLAKNANASQKQELASSVARLIEDEQMGKLFKVLAVCSENITLAGF